MAVFIIADIALHDTRRYQVYVDNVPALVAKHGGRYRVRGGQCEVLEGSWSPSRLILLEFPDREAALAFYNDPAYEPYRQHRQSISDGNVILVEGLAS